MSRTRKDRPVRVRLNDKTEPKSGQHAHERLGAAGTTFWGEDYRFADRCTIDGAGTRTDTAGSPARSCS